MDRETLIKKTIFNVFFYVIYYNAIFYFLKPEIYQNAIFVAYLAINYLTGIIDTYLRPMETETKEDENHVIFILFLFFVGPFLFILAVIENNWLFESLSKLISIIGLIVYFIGTVLLLATRIQLGKQATGTLVIVKDHELINTGIYRFVRHPMYASSLLGVLGFAIVTQTIIVGVLTFVLYFVIFNARANYEEKILEEQFGESYQDYVKKTKRFVPFIY